MVQDNMGIIDLKKVFNLSLGYTSIRGVKRVV